MKNYLLTLVTSLLSSMIYAQVDDIPIVFSKEGFIEAIDMDQKLIQINFFRGDKNLGDEDQLKSQVFLVDHCEFVRDKNDKKNTLSILDLRSNEKVKVDGQWFQEKDEYKIQKITLFSKTEESGFEGRVDLISGDFAYVDGKKVKLADGKQIVGDDDAGYKGQKMKSFNEIKQGIYAEVSGKYDNSGYFLANKVIISPDIETSYDREAFKSDMSTYNEIYPLWTDPKKRKSLFGRNIVGLGKITNNEAIQEYVNQIGQKLIPSHIKKGKIDFIFIVVDNPDLLAYVKPNGLSFICTGLLFNLENEAQLAHVLGHEIAHAIYEHQAGEAVLKKKKEQKTGLLQRVVSVGTTAYNKTTDIINGRDKKLETDKQKDTELERKVDRDKNQQILKENTVNTASLFYDKNSSDYSIDQEYQADRVGLCLAVLANYDPREAPIVWRNIYEKYGVVTTNNENGIILDKQVEALRKEDIENREVQYNTQGLLNQAATGIMKIKQESYKIKSVKTHPDEVKRFKALNNLVALYWNSPSLLDGTEKNEDAYRKALKNLAKTSKNQTDKTTVKESSNPQKKKK